MTITIDLDTQLPSNLYAEWYYHRGIGLMHQGNLEVGDTVYEFPVCKLPDEEILFKSKHGDVIFDPEIYLSPFAFRNKIFTYYDCFVLESSEEPNAVHDCKLFKRDGMLYSSVKCIKPMSGRRDIVISDIPTNLELTLVHENGEEEVIPESELHNIIPPYRDI